MINSKVKKPNPQVKTIIYSIKEERMRIYFLEKKSKELSFTYIFLILLLTKETLRKKTPKLQTPYQ